MDEKSLPNVVWLEDGREVPFEPPEPPRRWLEESLEWATGERCEEEPKGEGDVAAEAPRLQWL